MSGKTQLHGLCSPTKFAWASPRLWDSSSPPCNVEGRTSAFTLISFGFPELVTQLEAGVMCKDCIASWEGRCGRWDSLEMEEGKVFQREIYF